MAFQIPSNYASGYGEALRRREDAARRLGQGLRGAIKTPEEVFSLDVSDSVKGALSPLDRAYTQDVATWGDIDFGGLESAGKAWLDFKTEMESGGGRGYRWAKRKGLMDPIAFKQAYDERMNVMLPTIVQKLKDYQVLNRVSDKNMRKWISGNPSLQRMLIRTNDPDMLALATPKKFEGIVPGLWGAKGDVATAGMPLIGAGIFRGGQALATAKKGEGFADARKGFMKGVKPFSAIREGVKKKGGLFGKKAISDIKKSVRPGVGKGLQKSNVKKAEAVLKEAQTKYNKAKKAYKGKIFARTKDGKALNKSITAAKDKITGLKSGKQGAKVIGRFLKQQGVKGVYNQAVKHLGKWGAVKLMGKLAASGAMKAGGVMTGGLSALASTAFDAWAIKNLLEVIVKTAAEESGGLGRPGEMLMGPRATGKMPGQ